MADTLMIIVNHHVLLSLAGIGVGSTLFHATLQYKMQVQ
jgi:hypothetical protein